ncbi:mRNA stability protein mug134 [Colletotrichum spaethianum]|uniref:mRNA stability protein n=1 Tax=Colletotrichum spaethianum TaxID=700344 RepID=A0AA37PF78_9PEZI|nr:mRNA stability protein mug134 [Colletotrichum spaethianum]GKT51109.1 mRNA stability protein mug134 [Colletotrichum spaethianum]
MGSQQNRPDPTAAIQKEDRLRRLYGRAPARSDLLHNQLQRKYFDSGDYAMQDAHKSSSMGSVQTGTEHPLRRNISHPSAPVPTSSNVEDNAGDRHQDAPKEASSSNQMSHLREQTDKDTPNANWDGQQAC